MRPISNALVIKRPFEHLITGTCELKTRNGDKFYYTVVMEAYSRAILSHSLVEELSEDVVIATIAMAERFLWKKATLHITQKGAATNDKYLQFVANHPRFVMPKHGFKPVTIMTSFFCRYKDEGYIFFYDKLYSYDVLKDSVDYYYFHYNYIRGQTRCEGRTPVEILQEAMAGKRTSNKELAHFLTRLNDK